MSGNKKTATTAGTNPQALKIGSRVRCSDDHVEGRIVWANGVSVKIQWDDGEQVTWRRDSLANRPIEIFDVSSDQDQHTAPEVPEIDTAELPMESVGSPPATAEQPSIPPSSEPVEMSETIVLEQTSTAHAQAEERQPSEPPQEAAKPSEQTAEQPNPTSGVSTQPRMRKPKKVADDGKERKLSALDAAAKVLGEAGQPMTCQEMIDHMAAKGYWTSPKGRTPEATLYSAVLREIAGKGEKARFVKTERGKFTRNEAA
jgi:HB1, ASXL, restriction endonuclease HTH domain